MAKKLTSAQRRKSKKLAERLKRDPGVRNPFAVANKAVQRKKKRSR